MWGPRLWSGEIVLCMCGLAKGCRSVKLVVYLCCWLPLCLKGFHRSIVRHSHVSQLSQPSSQSPSIHSKRTHVGLGAPIKPKGNRFTRWCVTSLNCVASATNSWRTRMLGERSRVTSAISGFISGEWIWVQSKNTCRICIFAYVCVDRCLGKTQSWAADIDSYTCSFCMEESDEE